MPIYAYLSLTYCVLQLGLREWLEGQGHEFIVTDDKEGPSSVFQQHIKDVCALRPPKL